jgi:hypothetical protein
LASIIRTDIGLQLGEVDVAEQIYSQAGRAMQRRGYRGLAREARGRGSIAGHGRDDTLGHAEDAVGAEIGNDQIAVGRKNKTRDLASGAAMAEPPSSPPKPLTGPPEKAEILPSGVIRRTWL